MKNTKCIAHTPVSEDFIVTRLNALEVTLGEYIARAKAADREIESLKAQVENLTNQIKANPLINKAREIIKYDWQDMVVRYNTDGTPDHANFPLSIPSNAFVQVQYANGDYDFNRAAFMDWRVIKVPTDIKRYREIKPRKASTLTISEIRAILTAEMSAETENQKS
jgi:hypothetical protein